VASGRRVKAAAAAHAAVAEVRVAAAVAAAVAAVAEAVVVAAVAAVGAAVVAAVPVGQEGRGVAVRVDRAAMDSAGTPSAKAISWRTLSRSTASPRW
jgi:hypothetical protein